MPVVVAILAALAASAYGQTLDEVPVPVVPSGGHVEIPQYVLAGVATWLSTWLARAGGIPLQVTHVLSDTDRDLLRQVRESLASLVARR